MTAGQEKQLANNKQKIAQLEENIAHERRALSVDAVVAAQKTADADAAAELVLEAEDNDGDEYFDRTGSKRARVGPAASNEGKAESYESLSAKLALAERRLEVCVYMAPCFFCVYILKFKI